jgi:hypothetical protein
MGLWGGRSCRPPASCWVPHLFFQGKTVLAEYEMELAQRCTQPIVFARPVSSPANIPSSKVMEKPLK